MCVYRVKHALVIEIISIKKRLGLVSIVHFIYLYSETTSIQRLVQAWRPPLFKDLAQAWRPPLFKDLAQAWRPPLFKDLAQAWRPPLF